MASFKWGFDSPEEVVDFFGNKVEVGDVIFISQLGHINICKVLGKTKKAIIVSKYKNDKLLISNYDEYSENCKNIETHNSKAYLYKIYKNSIVVLRK